MTDYQGTRIDIEGVTLLSPPEIKLNGNVYAPDATKAYVKFKLAYGFPVVSDFKTAFHPAVVAKSFETMRHQVLNVGHKMKSYDPKKNGRDWIVGSIVDVAFPKTPFGGWKIGDKASTPGMECVAVVHKKAEKSQAVLGEHLTGRRKWTVSLESYWIYEDSGILVHDDSLDAVGRAESQTTPDDLRSKGWNYYAAAEDPDFFLRFYKPEHKGLPPKWRKEKIVILSGGLSGDIHYSGVGLVTTGAEDTAHIEQMLAEHPDAGGADELGGRLLGLMKQTVGEIQ